MNRKKQINLFTASYVKFTREQSEFANTFSNTNILSQRKMALTTKKAEINKRP